TSVPSRQYAHLPLHHKNPLRLLLNGLALKRFVQENDINLIHTHSRGPAWSCYLASLLTGIPWIATYHALYGHQNALKRFYNKVMLKANATIAISKTVLQHIQTVYRRTTCLERAYLKCIPRGINTSFFNPDAAFKPLDVQKTLGLPPKAQVLLVPGRASFIKGQLQVLKALKQLNIQKTHPNLKVILLGAQTDSQYTQKLKAYCQQHQLAKTVLLLPFAQDPRPFYQLADSMAVPTQKPEGFGRVIAEAGAMQLPVLAFNEGGAQEILLNAQTGLLVPPSELVQGLRSLIALSHTQRSRMGQKAQKRIQTHFNEEACHQRTLALYQTVLRTAKKSAAKT
ncbi:MAG: glycosyltransferase family 4 protein, partial [Holosporaceae bacterium]